MQYAGLTDSLLAIAGVIVAFALLIAVIRAKQDDLPAIVRALFGRPDDDDNGDGPPALT